MSAQTAQPDAAHLFLDLGNLAREIEHYAVLDGENDAHIAPGGGIRADRRVQVAKLQGALDKLTDERIDLCQQKIPVKDVPSLIPCLARRLG